MLKVRDKSLPKTDYKGREAMAIDPSCPCRPCWHPHDCGYLNSQGQWVMRMYCATNWNNGCPPQEQRAPSHVFPDRKRKCARCGASKSTAKKGGEK